MRLNVSHNCIWKSKYYARAFTSIFTRNIYTEDKIWVKKYKKETRVELENYWKNRLGKRWKTRKENLNINTNDKFYCLSMFPYPSGKLHMGHVRVYTISDTMAQYYRMRGKQVIHPMGWDAFGLPAENAAIQNGLDPADWTEKNIAYMKKQLEDLNLFFDWEREISTCSSEYYKWTQYLFLRLYTAGLAYRRKAIVNWDPVDETVLADEQVDENGHSWRSGAVVEKRLLKQWFLRTTKYAKSLLSTLDELDEKIGIRAMQRDWIGKIDGCYVDFKLEVDGVKSDESISIFCSQPELTGDATHVNLHSPYLNEFAVIVQDAGGHSSIKERLLQAPNGSLIDGIYAINPFTQTRIPFTVSDHHGIAYRSQTVLGIPSLHSDDAKIAQEHNLTAAHSKEEMTQIEALAKIKSIGCGQDYMASSSLRDWLISRQRKWGTPIPIVYCQEHGTVPVPEEELPVVLPKANEDLDQWKKTTCPKCGRPAVRETDTMDTFVDSSWYFMRYSDPHNKNSIFSKETCDQLMPVDLYIGGKEHAILHLYYARFMSHFCVDIGLTSHREPFKKLLAQGIIKGKTYRLKSSGKYLTQSQVIDDGSTLTEKSTGAAVEMNFEKMSKSKLNGVDPHEFMAEWGINMTRLFVLYAAAPPENIHWDVKTDVIPGMRRWQMKLWNSVTMLLQARNKPFVKNDDFDTEFNLAQQTNKTIEQVTYLFEKSCTLSAAITSLMTIARITANMKENVVRSSPEFERSICAQVLMATPMMPHFTSELWNGLRGMKYKLTDQEWDKEALDQKWPQLSVIEEPLKFNILVNNKLCAKLRLPRGFTDFRRIEERSLKHPKVLKRLKGKSVLRVVTNSEENFIQFQTECNEKSIGMK